MGSIQTCYGGSGKVVCSIKKWLRSYRGADRNLEKTVPKNDILYILYVL